MEFLANLPRDRWAERDENGSTLLHYAALGDHVTAAVALMRSGLVDVNAADRNGYTPAHIAVSWPKSRLIELLSAAGSNLRTRDPFGYAPIDIALHAYYLIDVGGVRILLANGVRLSTVRQDTRNNITLTMVVFERGVLRCRTAVVAMLRVKHAGNLVRWDKFLLREVAYAVWATRYDKGWQN